MCLEELEKDHGLVQIYRQMMPVDLFQAQYGGWLSNLPRHIKFLMGFGILVVLAVISCGIYFVLFLRAHLNPPRGNPPQKPATKLEAASDKTGKAGQSKTDISKELIKTAENLEDIHNKNEKSDKPVKGMEKLEKVKKAHDKLEKVKKELDKDN